MITEFFSPIVKVITDSTQRWTTRSAAGIVILVTLWLVNDTFDFINSFRTNNKLQQLETIGQLLSDSTLTKEQTDILITERQRIFKRQTVIDNVHSFVDSLPNPISLIRRSTTQKPDTTIVTSKKSLNKDDSVPIPTKNYWLNFISSNAFLLVVLLFVPFNIKFQKTGLWVIMVANAVVFGVLFLLCTFIAYLFDLIPVIAGMPWVNYILNFSVQLFFWMIIGFALSKKTKHVVG